MQFWDASTAKPVDILSGTRRDHRGLVEPSGRAVGSQLFNSDKPGEKLVYKFIGSKVAIAGRTAPDGGYAKVSMLNNSGDTVYSSLVDFIRSNLLLISASSPR